MGCSSSKRTGLRPLPPVPRCQSMRSSASKETTAGTASQHVVALTSSTLGSIKLDHDLLLVNGALEGWLEEEEEGEAGMRRVPPVSRCQSMPSSASKETTASTAGEHVVALTSSTLGSIKLDHDLLRVNGALEGWLEEEEEEGEASLRRMRRRHSDLSLEVFPAKTWSSMMEGRIPVMPRSPAVLSPQQLPRTPPEAEGAVTPETINAWELMEGLEDSSPNVVYDTVGSWAADKAAAEEEETVRRASPADSDDSQQALLQRASQESLLLSDPSSESEADQFVLFPAPVNDSASPIETEVETTKLLLSVSSPDQKSNWQAPLWEQVEMEESLASEFDIDIISDLRKSFHNLPPQEGSPSPPPEKQITEQKSEVRAMEELKPTKIFPTKPIQKEENLITPHSGIVKARVTQFQNKINVKKWKPTVPDKAPPESENKVVFYFTSLRGVRKTYEDCRRVGLILKGYNVLVDERDVSMHHRFRLELDEAFVGSGGWALPRVFVKGRHLGGAEEVRRLHETGEMERALEGCTRVEDGKLPCEGCGDVRFVNCETCWGSCKVYSEEEGGEGLFERCPDCNENGIIRCPVCCE